MGRKRKAENKNKTQKKIQQINQIKPHQKTFSADIFQTNMDMNS